MGKPKSSDRVVQRLRIGSKLLSELAIISLLIAVTGFSLRAQQPDMLPVLRERPVDCYYFPKKTAYYFEFQKSIVIIV